MEQPKADMMEEAIRIVDAASENGVSLRLLGGLATRLHCEIVEFCERDYSDIDLVGLSKEKQEIITVFKDLGYTPDERFNALHGHKRLLFEEQVNNRHIDVFLDHFDMDHDWDLSTRLTTEKYTLPLSDLLLMKLQICKINEKDVRDIITMLKDSTLGEEDAAAIINVEYIAEKCSDDWGLYESVLENVKTVVSLLDQYSLESEEKAIVKNRLKELMKRLLNHEKTAKWMLRSAVGTHMKWCESVEEQ
ncbi:MAG: hypothetical protein HXS44_11460 [Theionarchaea archaeon]|nr:hypothetical protein [Theionarchaea archaeon]